MREKIKFVFFRAHIKFVVCSEKGIFLYIFGFSLGSVVVVLFFGVGFRAHKKNVYENIFCVKPRCDAIEEEERISRTNFKLDGEYKRRICDEIFTCKKRKWPIAILERGSFNDLQIFR